MTEAGHLVLGGCDLVALAHDYGTPLYVYSKRTLLVLWKVAELAFMLIALTALSIPALCGPPGPSELLARTAGLMMIGAVFLMGVHSTFFVPAKYRVT